MFWRFYRPARDWRSNQDDAIELRIGLGLVQTGFIWGIAQGFGWAIWNREYAPLWQRNWWPAR